MEKSLKIFLNNYENVFSAFYNLIKNIYNFLNY